MARAKRHYLPGYAWHITHCCYEREFLLKSGKDRRRWVQWLFEAKKRYGLCILSFMAIYNLLRLLVSERAKREIVPRVMQLVAGTTGREYNDRKKRKVQPNPVRNVRPHWVHIMVEE